MKWIRLLSIAVILTTSCGFLTSQSNLPDSFFDAENKIVETPLYRLINTRIYIDSLTWELDLAESQKKLFDDIFAHKIEQVDILREMLLNSLAKETNQYYRAKRFEKGYHNEIKSSALKDVLHKQQLDNKNKEIRKLKWSRWGERLLFAAGLVMSYLISR